MGSFDKISQRITKTQECFELDEKVHHRIANAKIHLRFIVSTSSGTPTPYLCGLMDFGMFDEKTQEKNWDYNQFDPINTSSMARAFHYQNYLTDREITFVFERVWKTKVPTYGCKAESAKDKFITYYKNYCEMRNNDVIDRMKARISREYRDYVESEAFEVDKKYQFDNHMVKEIKKVLLTFKDTASKEVLKRALDEFVIH